MSHKDYIYIGDPIPKLSRKNNAAFLLHLQEAVIFSLEKRKMLTSTQCDQCIAELENRYFDSDLSKKT